MLGVVVKVVQVESLQNYSVLTAVTLHAGSPVAVQLNLLLSLSGKNVVPTIDVLYLLTLILN